MAKIEGVEIIPLKQFIDDRGAVYRVFRNYDHNVDVNEVYISKVNHGVVKGWKSHQRMTQRFSVPYGDMRIVLADMRKSSSTKGNIMEIELNPATNYVQLIVPPCVWYSFGCVSGDYALMVNVADMIHEDNEADVLPLRTDLIKYDWK